MLSRLSYPSDGLPFRPPVLLLAFLVSVAACDREEPSVDPTSPAATEATELAVAPDQALDVDRFVGIERVFARVWNRVPSFSGFWHDAQGRLVVGLTDESRRDDVVSALQEIGATSYLHTRNGARRSVVATDAARSFKTMIDWKHARL